MKRQQLIDSKLENLQPLKVYGYEDLGIDPNDSSVRSALSRRKDRIRKLSRGKFIIPSSKECQPNELYIKGHDTIAIKRGSIAAKKLILSYNIFWSNKNGQLPINNVIASVLERGGLEDIDVVRYKFGENRVVEVLLEKYD